MLPGSPRASSVSLPPPPCADSRLGAVWPDLLPFQRDGVRFVHDHGGRALIADEMGLGKTVQGIAAALCYRDEWPLVVIVPASVLLNWADEVERWAGCGPTDIKVVQSRADIAGIGSKPVVIATYGMFTATSPVKLALDAAPPRVIVVDESHALKSRTALRSKCILPLVAKARRAVLLSGTPALARPEELYTQMHALRPAETGAWWPFAKRFCRARRTHFGWDTAGASNLPDLHAALRPIMIRRLKADVLTQLPSKRRQRLRLRLPPRGAAALAKTMKALESEIAALGAACDADEAAFSRAETRRLISEAYMATADAKKRPVQEYLADMLVGAPEPVLVFAHHQAMLDALEETCAAKKVAFMRIDGAVPPEERQRRVKGFQDGKFQVALLSMTAAGQGLTLTRATQVVFAELHWTPGVLVQAEDRCHRIGQTNAVNVHYLTADASLDDRMWRCIAKKTAVVGQALDGARKSLGVEDAGHASSADVRSGVNGLVAFAAGATEPAAPEARPPAKGGIKWFFAKASTGGDRISQGKRPVSAATSRKRGRARVGTDEKGADAEPVGVGKAQCAACQRQRAVGTHDIEGWGAQPLCAECARSLVGKDTRRASSACDGSGKAAVARRRESASPRVSTPPASATVPAKDFAQYSFVVSAATGRVFMSRPDGTGAASLARPATIVATFKPDAPPSEPDLAKVLACPGETARAAVAAAAEFAAQWLALRGAARRELAGVNLRLPLSVAVAEVRAAARDRHPGKGPTTERYLPRGSDEAAARRALVVPGTSKDASVCPGEGNSAGTCEQRADCVECGADMRGADPEEGKGMDLGPFVPTNLPCRPDAWWSVACSLKCFRAHTLRKSGAEIRRQLFALEHGVCQLCTLDAHELFVRVRALPPPERLAELQRAGFRIGTGKQAEALLRDPKEGMLWQADHEVAVAEGGGQCSIFNFRTLCTPCHARETRRLHQSLKATALKRAAVGSQDIRTLFASPARKAKGESASLGSTGVP